MYILGSESSVPGDPNGVLAGSKMTHSVCVCSAQSVALLVDAMDGDFAYKDLIKLTNFLP